MLRPQSRSPALTARLWLKYSSGCVSVSSASASMWARTARKSRPVASITPAELRSHSRLRASSIGATRPVACISTGTTIGIRGSFEGLPTIRVDFAGPGAPDTYVLTNGRAYDAGIGLFVADRSAGWGLGSRAFIIAGAGRIRSDLGDDTRVFAEGGGGLSSGPLGVELSVKFAWNRLDQPVAHRFLTVPVTVRGTLSF